MLDEGLVFHQMRKKVHAASQWRGISIEAERECFESIFWKKVFLADGFLDFDLDWVDCGDADGAKREKGSAFCK